MAKYLSFFLLFVCASVNCSDPRSCQGRCGQGYYKGSLCQCDFECLGLNECCSDFESLCTTKNSCKGRCGEPFNRGNPCHCDFECTTYNQCCSDYESQCLVEESSNEDMSDYEELKDAPAETTPSEVEGSTITITTAGLLSTTSPGAPTITISLEVPTNTTLSDGPVNTTLSDGPTTIILSGGSTSTITTEDSTTMTSEGTTVTEDPTTTVPTEDPTTTVTTESPTSTIPTEEPTTIITSESPTTTVTTEEPTTTVTTEMPTSTVPTEELTTTVKTESTTSTIPTELPTSTVPTESTTSTVPTELPTSTVPTESTTSTVPTEEPTTTVPEMPTSTVPTESTTSTEPTEGPASTILIPGTTLQINPTEDVPYPQDPGFNVSITPTQKPTEPTSDNDKIDKGYQADDYDTDLCSGRPVSALTTLRNGTIVVFRGHYFWTLDKDRNPDPARLITNVWGIPSPIDTVFTRCNCQGKTYFFKGNKYWRFEDGTMDTGFPKHISQGFGRINHITAALSIPQYRSRKESVIFFRRGGLAQKYTYQVTPSCGSKPRIPVFTVRKRFRRDVVSSLGTVINISRSWRGFPSIVTSAVSVPSRVKEQHKYYVFSQKNYYSMKMERERPVILKAANGQQENTANSFFKCPQKL